MMKYLVKLNPLMGRLLFIVSWIGDVLFLLLSFLCVEKFYRINEFSALSGWFFDNQPLYITGYEYIVMGLLFYIASCITTMKREVI